MSERAPGAGDSDAAAAIAAIWARHRDDAMGRVTVLEDAVAALLENRLSEGTRRGAERDAHRLAGSAGTFGFLHASESARRLEGIFAGTESVPPAGILLAADEVVALRTAFDTGPAPAPAGEPHASSTTRPGADPRHRAVNQEPRWEQTGAAAAHGPQALVASRPARALTSSNRFRGRAEAARSDARGLLAAAAPPQELLNAVEGLLTGPQTAGATVLVIVDPAVLAAVGAVLVPAGLRVVGLEDPARLWAALKEEQPDLVILDLDMGQVSGGELCREIRADVQWSGLPVLFLTEHSDPATVGAVFAAGADDFVARPFSGPELLARVQARIERIRLLRALVETDPLTGLASRRRAEPYLQLLLSLAKRHGQPFSIALLDLDGFKNVNAQHGHALGDAVLRHVGSLLRQSFRLEDVVARWGGHEFLLGMHGMARRDGEQFIASLLEALREERFITPSGSPLAVTFSAGVGTYPEDATTVAGLCEAASQAMSRSNRAAGDRVLPAAAPVAGHNLDVVVVEDDKALAELLEHALTTCGYRFHHLADGRAAADQLTGSAPALRPRVLLLDVDLPVLNGFGVLRQLAAAGTLSSTRVVMLTARSSEREVIEALKLGAFDHIAKPFSVPVLMQRLRRALET